MVVPLDLCAADDPVLLKEVVFDLRSDDLTVHLVEVELDVLAEPRGVVVSSCPRVSEGLEDRIGAEDPLAHRRLARVYVLASQ